MRSKTIDIVMNTLFEKSNRESLHEKWDGSGYPNGLTGEKIPLEARIIAVADAYDAMTSERSYRKGLEMEEAIKELKRCSGTQFDPEIVDVFVNRILPHYIDFGGDEILLSAVQMNHF